MDLYEKAWAGKHGKEYSERCDVTPESREVIFFELLKLMNISTTIKELSPILEVGCNKGHNLEAINRVRRSVFCHGIEINKSLCTRPGIIHGSAYDLPWGPNVFDLVFTSGVLIHIPPGRLHEAMNQMRHVSKKYVLMIEYYADKEKGTKYEEDFNFQEGVWSRPYGDIYTGHFPKDRRVMSGKISDLGDDGWGFSKCHYWIFEKVA